MDNLDLKSPQIKLSQTEPIVCEKCQNQVFFPGVMLRKVSKFISPNGQDSLIPMQVFACSKCGHVNQDFLPLEMNEQ